MLLLKPFPAVGGIILFLLAFLFPPLFLIPVIWGIVIAVRKVREHTDPQARAHREAIRWYEN